MGNKTRSKHQEGLYKTYQSSGRHAKNRKRKLERALKRNPENLQIVEALKNIKYRRHTPNSPVWTKGTKAKAKLLKSQAKDVSVAKVTEKTMFSIAARAMDGMGRNVWSS